MYGEFRDEARDQIGSLDAALLRLEDDGELPEEERAALLRALHTLKGNSGMLGRTELAEAVHDLEGVFKESRTALTRAELDSLFELAAALRRAVEQVGADDEEVAQARVRELRQAVRDAAAGGSPATASDGVAGRPRGGSSDPAIPAVPDGEDGAVEGDAGAPIARSAADRRTITPGGAEPAADGDAEDPAVSGSAGEDAPAAQSDPGGEIVRVPFAALDALLNRVGELVTLETRMEALLRHHRSTLEIAGLRRPLEETAEGLARLSGSLHQTTMELRLVPVHRVFERFRSVIRDLAREQDKRVRVELEGGDVRIDKGMADAIAEPLLHLVRNAVDHGIEPPDAREAAGRDPTGTVRMAARRSGDRVRISVEDDGRGLDRAGIAARARDLHLLNDDEALTPEAAGDVIFQPGFSTRAEATTVSGRGVGLDVVRRRAISLRGTLSVETPEAGGTRFVLDLPLTMAIVPAVLFETAGQVLAFATADVAETLGSVRTEMAGGAEVLRRGDDLVPIARLGRLFGWSEGTEDPEREPFAVLVKRGSRTLAVVADRLLDQRDIVVKPVPAYLGGVPSVTGVAVPHEGSVVLLLDVSGILELNLDNHRRRSSGA